MEIQRRRRNVRKRLTKGDMVEFPSRLYSHWGVYIGEGRMVHKGINRSERLGWFRLMSPFSCCGVLLKKTSVHIALVDDVAGNRSPRCNNYLDSTKQPLPTRIIRGKAMSKLGEDRYNVFYENCEHFATWCRYGEAFSKQVSDYYQRCLLVLLTILAFLFFVVSFFYFY